jgi:hypothetical protein
MSVYPSNPPIILLDRGEFQTLIRRIFIEFKLWLFVVTKIS